MKRLRSMLATFRGFKREDRGAVLVEAIVVVPFVTLFAVGILEFGNMFWQKQQIEVGLRDAARYMARCQRHVSFSTACNATKARSIAFYGSASPPEGAALRVPGWGPDAGDITITEADVVRVETSHVFQNSPLFGWLSLDAVTVEAFHEERYMGW